MFPISLGGKKNKRSVLPHSLNAGKSLMISVNWKSPMAPSVKDRIVKVQGLKEVKEWRNRGNNELKKNPRSLHYIDLFFASSDTLKSFFI